MGKFEQIPAAVKSMDEPEKKEQKSSETLKKIADGNTISAEKIDGRDSVEAISEETAKELSDAILQSSETKAQIKQLKQIGEKYRNKELKDVQRKQYEDLMSTIKTELDRDVPTVIEMNKEIDINYYNKHPDEAAEEANKIVKAAENMSDVDLVNKVISQSEYLGNDSKQKVYNVIKSVEGSIKMLNIEK